MYNLIARLPILSHRHTPTLTTSTDIPVRQNVERYIVKMQEDIVAAFENMDPNAPAFKRDSWL